VRSALRSLESSTQIGRPTRVSEVRPPWMPPLAATPSPASHPGEPAPQMSLFIAPTGEHPAADDGTAPVEIDPGVVRPVLWQVHDMYLFAETRSGLIIVDQHSAHERVLYEEIMGGYDAREPDSQRLLFPITLRLTPAELAVVEEFAGLFTQVGFEIEPFGGHTVIVHAVPQPHPHFDGERCIREMISELATGSALVDAARNQHQRLALTFACKGAIKA